MPKKVKTSDLKQLDIIAAMRGQDVVIEEKEEEKIEPEKNKVDLWAFVNDIRRFKRGDLLDEDQNHAIWNSFMVYKALSMKTQEAWVLNLLNQYITTLSKEQLYIALLQIVEKDSTFYKYIKNVKEEKGEYIEFVSKYYECSEKEAQEYIEVMGDEWSKKIKEKFGDFV